MGFGLCTQPPPSTILEMLSAYGDALSQRMGTSPALAPHGVPRPELLQENVCELIQDTVRSFTRWDAVGHFDGCEKPLVFTKDLLVAAEAEFRVNGDTVITSLQYKRP
ncbi:hypothetical protein STCU_10470 [Strigomonas culicis]|uniref:Uncharacterized protein n=1 Tax=Strigomonas culicis TaxID=28005 RepID=S9TLJ5_9TRYP|nr:hypothetical protein STCU_10470 [Strigomonas culicis]|eukprot:EPY17674.1 hypothetical protein STCU_10470 [Strigomonas culicis]